MRLFWLPFCCILASISQAQAESNRSADDGLMPIDIVQRMPNPMNMFDSSDRRRYERPRRPPRPRIAPGYHYPRPPAYAPPPRPPVPYTYRHPAQPPQQAASQSEDRNTDQGVITNRQAPVEATPYSTTTAPVIQQQTVTPTDPGSPQSAYSFRPMIPVEPGSETNPTEVPDQAPTSVWQQPPTTSGGSSSTAYTDQESPMVNGQPAIFRPMHLGIEDPPSQ